MDICESETGDGCGLYFPNKSSAGLCAKCNKLASLDEHSPEYAQWKAYNQCNSTGIAWKNLASSLCGRCAHAATQPSQALDLARTALETSRAARSQSIEAHALRAQIPVSREDSMRWVEEKFERAAATAYNTIGEPALDDILQGWSIFSAMAPLMHIDATLS